MIITNWFKCKRKEVHERKIIGCDISSTGNYKNGKMEIRLFDRYCNKIDLVLNPDDAIYFFNNLIKIIPQLATLKAKKKVTNQQNRSKKELI